MNNSIIQFNTRLQELKDLTATIDQVDRLTTGILNINDLYRSQVVLIVSSLDHFLHEFVLEEMIEIYNRRRNSTNAFDNFQIPISATVFTKPSDIFLSSHIRQKHSWLSFQDPNKIADAIRLISEKKLWEEIASFYRLSAGDLKIKIKLVIDRRNKIAHESDSDPSYPGMKWPISTQDVKDIADFVESLGNEIYNKIK